MAARSKAYPFIALSEALKKTEKINENFGLTGQFNRETIASGMGYSSLSGTASRAVAALVQYGLLNRIKDQYELSILAKKYLIPNEDHDVEEAIKETALNPKLFKEIYEKFEGQTLPRQFANRLINEFGIQQKAASDVERLFKATMTRASMLQPNGILSSKETAKSSRSTSHGAEKPGSKGLSAQSKGESTPEGMLTVELPSGLVIGYSNELAHAFAFGQFGTKLKELDKEVSEYKKNNAPPDEQGNTSVPEEKE